jgi:hypothetical protein
MFQGRLDALLERQTFRGGIGRLRARSNGASHTKPGQNISQSSHWGWRLLDLREFVKSSSFPSRHGIGLWSYMHLYAFVPAAPRAAGRITL